MDAQAILILLFFILGFDFLFGMVLNYLNYRSQGQPVPAEVSDVYEEEKYQRSIRYNRERIRFSVITAGFSFTMVVFVLATGALGWLDGMINQQIQDPVFQALAFFAVLFVITDLINLPFSWYSQFVIEEKYGFNKMSTGLFIRDKLKGYLLGIILGGGIGFIFLTLVNELGHDFWWIFWMVSTVFMVLMNMFYTSWIVPLFNKLTPLAEGELKTAIETFAGTVRFPLKNIYVIDGSKRSSRANAYFSGIGGRKKIVLYDTLISNHSTEELVAVLAHEIGHYKKKHVLFGLFLSVIQTGLMLFILSLMIFNGELTAALGGSGISIPLNLVAFAFLFSPISMVTGLLMNVLSRRNEFEADAYAANFYEGEALVSALKKLAKDHLTNLTPSKLYIFFNYSHPPLMSRIRAIRERAGG